MADVQVGVSSQRELYLESDGAPLTGATLTYDLVGPTGATLLTDQAVTEDGSGWYHVALDGSTYLATVGLYRGLWHGAAGSLDVLQPDTFLAAAYSGPLVTLLQLRHQIAARIGDLWRGQAVSGTGTTLVDANRVEDLASVSGHWRGKYLYIYGGTGRGQERAILSSSSGGTLTVGQAWATTPDSTSRYEIHACAVQDYLDAINLAILEVVDMALVTVVDETLLEVTSTVEYTLPAGLAYVAEVAHRDTTGTADWQTVDRARWALVPGRGVLRLTGAATNNRLRLVGQLRPDLLQHDSSFCLVDPAYLTFKAAENLLTGRILSPQIDRDAILGRVKVLHDLAEAQRPDYPPLPNAVRVS